MKTIPLATSALSLAVLLAGLHVGGAAAGAGEETNPRAQWQREAGAAVNDAMAKSAPRSMARSQRLNGTVVVTALVASDGRVLDAAITEKARRSRSALNRAARDCIEKLERLPALDGVFAGEQRRIRIHLVYAENKKQMEREMKRAQERIVNVRRIAQKAAPGDGLARPRVIDLIGTPK